MKTLVKQGFLTLVILAAIANTSEHPDQVEEMEDMLDSPNMNSNRGKNINDDNDVMSDDTSSGADEDKDMMEAADTSDDEEYEIFDEAASYENKSVEKSKIQHNSKPNNNKEKDDMDGYKKGNDSAVNVTKIDNLAKGDSDNTEIEKEKSRQYEKMKQENDAEDDANEWSERKGRNFSEVSSKVAANKGRNLNEVSPSASDEDTRGLANKGNESKESHKNGENNVETAADNGKDTDKALNEASENRDRKDIKSLRSETRDIKTLKSTSKTDNKPEVEPSKNDDSGNNTDQDYRNNVGYNKNNTYGGYTNNNDSHKINKNQTHNDSDEGSHNINETDINKHKNLKDLNKTNEQLAKSDVDHKDTLKPILDRNQKEDKTEGHKKTAKKYNDKDSTDENPASTVEKNSQDKDDDRTKQDRGKNAKFLRKIGGIESENAGKTMQVTSDSNDISQSELTADRKTVAESTEKDAEIINTEEEKDESKTNIKQNENPNDDDSEPSKQTKDKKESFPNANRHKAHSEITQVAETSPDVENQNDKQRKSASPSLLAPDGQRSDGNYLSGLNVTKGTKNSDGNLSADNMVDDSGADIQQEVEQLSMKTGDESEEEQATLGRTSGKYGPHTITSNVKQDGMEDKAITSNDNSADGSYGKSEGVSEKASQLGENGMASEQHDSPSGQVDPTNGQAGVEQIMNKVDVVNTLLGVSSGDENTVTGASEVDGDQSTGENIQQRPAGQTFKNKTMQGKKGNVESLLHDLVPTGTLPNLPEGFGKLSEMSTVSFTYSVHENNDVTVTSGLKEPMQLFDGKLAISNANLEFSYSNKEKPGQKWQFKAQGSWVNGEQEIKVILESSKHENHFTLTGKGDSLALHDYFSMFAKQETFQKSGLNMHVFEEIMLTDIELYVVFHDFDNIVSFVSGNVKDGHGTQASHCQAFIEKFPGKDSVFSMLLDFEEGSASTVLPLMMVEKLADIPYVKDLLDSKGLMKVANGSFGFAASSADVKKLRLDAFGDGMLERDLGSHISHGVTLTLPISFHSQNKMDTHDIIVKISDDAISFFPTKSENVNMNDVFRTLSGFTRPKISSLGYPDLGNVLLRELRYDLPKSVYTAVGYSRPQFNIAPGMLYLHDANLEFRQEVPDEFATLALYGSGSANIGQAKVNITLHTDSVVNELLITGQAHTLWLPDIASSFGVAMELGDDVRRILDENRMLNMNMENARIFGTVKNGQSGLIHFSGNSRPTSWNDAIQVEAVVFHDNLSNKRRMMLGYLFEKLPLTYAIDAFSFKQFPTPRLLDNSRNTTLILSPVNTESLFLNPVFDGLSFMRGLSLVGQFRLPDVCSLNTLCESAAQLLGSDKWYRVQGLVSSRGYTLAGYVDKDFNLARGLKLTDNILEFVLGNQSYMSIATVMRLDENNLTFNGFVNFDANGVRLRMSSNDLWQHPFPGKFLTFDRLQIDVPLVSGIAMEELLATGELIFGLSGSLYRIFAPSYLTFNPSKGRHVNFQATMTNITLETITSALNFKTNLPGVLLNSRFPDTLILRYMTTDNSEENLELYGKLDMLSRTLMCKLRIDENKQIRAITSHSKFPLILDDGLIAVYADLHRTRLGPRASFMITPESTKFKLEGFANFMGLGAKTEIDVSETGTEFSLSGSLFGVTNTDISFMCPDSLPENGPYFASACLPDIISHVTSQVYVLLTSAADQAERYMKQASANLNQAIAYHKQALAEVHKNILMLDGGENYIENEDRDMFLAEERYNKTCVEQACKKTCIGCTSWLKCCDRDVFGNCVKCPGWKACCWHGKSPICKAKNHACRIMKQVNAENFQKIARRVYANRKKKWAKEKMVWKSEYMKGKTQAVLDAARRAVDLVNHDSRRGLDTAKTIKRFGLERMVNVRSVCFHTTLKKLATSCVTMTINASFANEEEMQSLPYYGCLNRDLVPKIANHIANFMFRDKKRDQAPTKQAKVSRPKAGHRRGGNLFGKPLEEDEVDPTTLPLGNTYILRRRRSEFDPSNDDMESTPFWLIRNNYHRYVPSLLQQRTTVPRTPFKKKWQIPESRRGKCKVYRQLVEICKDMMATVKKMSQSYDQAKQQYRKRLTELQLGLNTTIYDVEKQAMDTPELRDRLPDIEMNVQTVSAGIPFTCTRQGRN